jgi:hypothetical protein
MALSKTTSTVLKTGVTIAGTAAAFTPVGGLVGLTGVAAVAADVVGGAVIGGVADKLGHKAKSEIDKNTEKSKDKSKKDTKPSESSKTASSEMSHNKSSLLKKTATVAATGAGTLGLAKLLGNNKNGRSTSATTSKFASDLKKIQDSSTKNYQKDLARAGIANTGSAAQQASMS